MRYVALTTAVLVGLVGCSTPAEVALVLPAQDHFLNSTFARVLAYDVDVLGAATCVDLIQGLEAGSFVPDHDTGLQPVCASLEGTSFGDGGLRAVTYDPFQEGLRPASRVAYVAVYYERDRSTPMLTGCTMLEVGEPAELRLRPTTYYNDNYNLVAPSCPSAESMCSGSCP